MQGWEPLPFLSGNLQSMPLPGGGGATFFSVDAKRANSAIAALDRTDLRMVPYPLRFWQRVGLLLFAVLLLPTRL